MTNLNHTDTSRSVTTLTAPTLSVVGNFVPPSGVTFFDGDSVIRINRNGTLELGPKWADAGDAATAFFNELVSRVVPSWNARIEALEAENERLRKLTCATWFYMPDEGDCCWFSPHEVIDEMYDPEPGNHVFEVECATSLPSIWCAVRVTDDPDADERFTFTEHDTEAEARAALGEKQ